MPRFSERFEGWHLLGGGAGGTLYRVRDLWTDRQSALKIANRESEKDALVSEFRLLTTLRHPCLIESHDLVWDDGSCAELFEYLPAINPKELWSLGGEQAVVSVLVQALRSIAYLHRQGFVHSDISPGNILIWKENDNWRAKVADLGLIVGEASALSAGVRGTPGYMAPEVAAGRGFGPAADYYSLALTAVAWIDGQDPWGRMSSTALLKEMSKSPNAPLPKRNISASLQSLLTSLGQGKPDLRTYGSLEDLRGLGGYWGPPTVQGTVLGTDDAVREGQDWAQKEVAAGRVGVLTVKGRAGSGRHTLARTIGRRLVSLGWTSLLDVPANAMKDWLAKSDFDPDPMNVAQELAHRFAERDLVVIWPGQEREGESRLLRAFLELRDVGRSGPKTIVIRTQSIQEGESGHSWIDRFTSGRSLDWHGPTEAHLKSLVEDVFFEEPGYVDGDLEVSTPLAVETLKKLSLMGEQDGDVRIDGELSDEVEYIWSTSDDMVRSVLGVLSLSSLPWLVSDLEIVLDPQASRGEWMRSVENSHITKMVYEHEEPSLLIPDWVTKLAVAKMAWPPPYSDLRTVYLKTEASGVHKNDIGLALELAKRGVVSSKYFQESMDDALAKGNFDEVLAIWESLDPDDCPVGLIPLLDRFLRASQKLGRYGAESKILAIMLQSESHAEARTGIRKMMAENFKRSGHWKECIAECEVIESSSGLPLKDLLWAGLQKAEVLWQAGQFSKADSEYERVKVRIERDMVDEWLRYSVGRARQSGQQGDLAHLEQYLAEAREMAGSEKCEQDPMYLHTQAGLMIQKGEYVLAKKLIQSSMTQLSSRGEWLHFVMASLRAANIEHGLGAPKEESKMAKKGVAVAAALGSDLAWGRMRGSLAHAELYLGDIGGALSSAAIQKEVAIRLSDRTMQIQANRSLGETASYAGWAMELENAVQYLRVMGNEVGDKECVAKADVYEGVFELGRMNWTGARERLSRAVEELKAQGRLDDMLRTRLLLGLAIHHLKERGDAHLEVESVTRFLERINYPSLGPVASLARAAVLGPEYSMDGESGADELWMKESILEYLIWVPEALPSFRDGSRFEARRNLLNAIQKMADTIGSPDMRREFLSFPRTKGTLRLVAG